jgi:hypothetical protein
MPTSENYIGQVEPDPWKTEFVSCRIGFQEPDLSGSKPAPRRVWAADDLVPPNQRPQRTVRGGRLVNCYVADNVEVIGQRRIHIVQYDVDLGPAESFQIDGEVFDVPRKGRITYGYWDVETRQTVLYDEPDVQEDVEY